MMRQIKAHKNTTMKKTLFIAMIALLTMPVLNSCREEKEVEVETLAPDVEDTNSDQGFDTNPKSGDDQ